MNPLTETTITRDILSRYVDENAKLCFENTFFEESRICTVAEISGDKIIDSSYVLVAILVDIVHKYQDNKEEDKRTWRNEKNTKPYDRLFRFIDTVGKTFNIISDSGTASQALLSLVGQHIGIGSAFIINDPCQQRNSVMGEDTLILRTSDPLIPLQQKFISIFPSCPINEPTTKQESIGYVLHGVSIGTQGMIRIICKDGLNPVSCKMFLCDRQKHGMISKACGCLVSNIQDNYSPVVIDMKIIIKNSLIQSPIEFRSYRTTLAIIENPNPIGLMPKQQIDKRRKEFNISCSSLIDYVNNNGGWDVVGLAMRGEKHDASNPNEKIASDIVTYHVHYLLPTDQSILKQRYYKSLKYKCHYDPGEETLQRQARQEPTTQPLPRTATGTNSVSTTVIAATPIATTATTAPNITTQPTTIATAHTLARRTSPENIQEIIEKDNEIKELKRKLAALSNSANGNHSHNVTIHTNNTANETPSQTRKYAKRHIHQKKPK